MKPSNFLIVVGLIVGFSAQNVQAQTLSNINPISFGDMLVGGTGDVTIPATSDTRSATGAIALVGSGIVQRASVDITFTPGAQVTITYPASIVMVGGNNPIIDFFVNGGTVQTIPPGGVLTVYFGATITFLSSGISGTATTIVPVTVDPL